MCNIVNISMAEQIECIHINLNLIDKIKNNALSKNEIHDIKNKPLKFIYLENEYSIDILHKYFINNKIISSKGIFFCKFTSINRTNIVKLNKFNKLFFLFNKNNKNTLTYFSFKFLGLQHSEILKYINISLVDNLVLKYLDLTNLNNLSNYRELHQHEINNINEILILTSKSLINNTSIELINIDLSKTTSEVYKYIELLFKNKINLKYLYIKLGDNVKNEINYLIKGLSNPSKPYLNTLETTLRSKSFKNKTFKKLYSYFYKNKNKLLNLRILEINILEKTNYRKLQTFFNKIEQSLRHYSNLTSFNLNTLYGTMKYNFYGSQNLIYHNNPINDVRICVEINDNDKYKNVYDLANSLKSNKANSYRLIMFNKDSIGVFDNAFDLTGSTCRYSNLFDSLIIKKSEININNEIDISLINKYIELLPNFNLDNIYIIIMQFTDIQFNMLLDKLLCNSKTLKALTLKISFENNQCFNNLNKLILFLKSAVKLETIDIYFINYIDNSTGIFIIFLILLYCINIKKININLCCSNNNISSDYKCLNIINEISKDYSYIDTLKFYINFLNNFYSETNNLMSIISINDVLDWLKKTKLEIVHTNFFDLSYNLILYSILIFTNNNSKMSFLENIFYVNSYDSFAIFNYYLENIKVNSKFHPITNMKFYDFCNSDILHINGLYNKLFLYLNVLIKSPYSNGYFKTLTGLNMDMNKIKQIHTGHWNNRPSFGYKLLKNNDINLILNIIKKTSNLKSMFLNDDYFYEDCLTSKLIFCLNQIKNLNKLTLKLSIKYNKQYEEFLKKVLKNIVNLDYLYVDLRHSSYLVDLTILMIINKFKSNIKYIDINSNYFNKKETILSLKLVLILISKKKNLNNILIPKFNCFRKVINVFMKSFNKRSLIALIDNKIIDFEQKILRREEKKMFQKFCIKNKLKYCKTCTYNMF